MKIVLNGRFLLPGRLEGIGYYTLEIINQLSKRFPNIEFIVLVDRQVQNDFDFSQNVSFKLIRPQARHPILFYIWFQFGVKNYLKSISADLFISFDGFCTLGSPCPTIICIHDLAFKYFPDHISIMMHRYYEYFTPKFIKESNLIVTVSEFSRSEIEKFYPQSKGKVELSCNAVRDSWLDEAKITEVVKQDYFVVLGAIQPRKNLGKVIEAFMAFKRQTNAPTKLKIVGRKGWKFKSIMKSIKSSPYNDDIVLTGYLEDTELIRCIRSARALIYVSLYEGFGVPILEAMAMDTVVITSDGSSMKEVAGSAAYLVNPKSTNHIAQAMEDIYMSPELREKLQVHAHRRYSLYTWEKAAQAYIAHIESMTKA